MDLRTKMAMDNAASMTTEADCDDVSSPFLPTACI